MGNKYKEQFEEYLSDYNFDGALSDSIKYIILASANRVRPQLVMAWCEACGGDVIAALPISLAVECVHTMSLLHDDLPCMDDEKNRRSKPCLHTIAGESTALLTGDTLLCIAFSIICSCDLSDKQKVSAIKVLSNAACLMADGQYNELNSVPCSLNSWQEIHYGKTAALLEASCALGVIVANGTEQQISEAKKYGESLGLAYQLMDDMRDKDGSSQFLDDETFQKLIGEYTNACNLGNSSEPFTFLSNLAKKVLI